MRAGIERWLNRTWYGDAAAPGWLRCLEPVYRAGFLAHRAVQLRRQPARLRAAPILVVGNLTAGGTGKTPLVIRLCRVLREAGLRPGVISRGYGRAGREPLKVTADTPADLGGDEALLIARRTGAPVMVNPDRCAAAMALLDNDVDVVVADDGLQHHRLPRVLEVCVIDGRRAFGNGRLLPAGPLREPLSRLQRVDHVVVNTEDALAEPGFPGAVPMTLAAGLLRSLAGGQSWRVSQFAGCRANAVAGIGNPERFFEALEHAGLKIHRHAFPDHHPYRAEDFDAMEAGLPLIMTEKDAVKCRDLPLENAWYLSVEASLPHEWEQQIVERMRKAVARYGEAR